MSKFQPPATVAGKAVTLKDTTDTARALITRMAPEIALALPKHLNPERIGRICLTEIRKNPKLLECSQASLAAGIIQSAQFGLELGSGLNLAWLIPYKNKDRDGNSHMEAQFQMGYQGLIELARRSGKLLSIFAEVVYSDEEFEIVRGLDSNLIHKPARRSEEPPNSMIVGAYAVAELPHGTHVVKQWEWVPRWRIDKIRRSSKAPDGPGWSLWFPDMSKKTALKALGKMLPKSAELTRAIEVDDAHDMGTQDLVGEFTVQPDVVTVEPEPEEQQPGEQPEVKVTAQERKTAMSKAKDSDAKAAALDRLTKHVESGKFTLQSVKDLAHCSEFTSLPTADLVKVADQLDALVKAEQA
jgi:recombination protein RecT